MREGRIDGEEYQFSCGYIQVSRFDLHVDRARRQEDNVVNTYICEPYKMTECPNLEKFRKNWCF